MYTPTNEHFGIGPVEGMLCGLPVLACDSGGPTESIVDSPPSERTGWLRRPDAGVWADALEEIGRMSEPERGELACRSQDRARSMFGVEAMAGVLEVSLVEAVEMGPVRAPISLKEIGFVLEFVLGLVLATLFKV